MNRTYELLVVFHKDLPIEEATLKEKVEHLIGGAAITTFRVIGKKNLAYPVKKQHEGIYTLATISAPSLATSAIERQAKVGTDILRFLLTCKEEA